MKSRQTFDSTRTYLVPILLRSVLEEAGVAPGEFLKAIERAIAGGRPGLDTRSPLTRRRGIARRLPPMKVTPNPEEGPGQPSLSTVIIIHDTPKIVVHDIFGHFRVEVERTPIPQTVCTSAPGLPLRKLLRHPALDELDLTVAGCEVIGTNAVFDITMPLVPLTSG